METIVVSGPVDRAAQARSMLQQKGFKVEQSTDTVKSPAGPVAKRDYNYGFEQTPDTAFITAQGDLEDWHVVESLGFQLRLHWLSGSEGEWTNKSRASQQDDLAARYERLVAALKAANIALPEGV